MIVIDEIYRFVRFLMKKHQRTGHFSADEFNLASKQTEINIFRKYGPPTNSQATNISPAQSTQRQVDYMAPFQKEQLILLDDGGWGALPDDYHHWLSATTKVPKGTCKDQDYDRVEVDNVQSGQWNYRTTSLLLKKPIFRFRTKDNVSGVEVHPRTTGNLTFEYYRQPTYGKWAFATSGTSQIYDPATSTDYEWDYLLFGEISLGICRYFGMSIDENGIIQAAEAFRDGN